MAKNVKLAVKIHEIKQIPNSRSYLLSIQYKQGRKTWYKPWRFTPTKPISMEWLEKEVAKLDPWPEEDFMQNVYEEANRPFNIEVLPAGVKPEVEGVAKAVQNQPPPVQNQQIAVSPGTILE